ncbi:uncharacterized protein [Nicotiana tomentosiformis]|uniref:uncharacterized protein n=1 Tax=Nicotiana tomentosiformis TaxID=4098 RepID=UPI00051C2D2E|nr:uncharacterized protein LOC104108341 [Nicotiana tomentosiformis]
MRNLSFSDEDNQSELPKTAIWWWRTPQDFDENGHLKVDISNLSNLTPRLKLLREMERLALISSEGIEDLRHKLITYRCGDFWLPVGGIKKEDMDIPPVITLLLVGLSASGKSSLVNYMYSVLGRSGLIPFAQTSSGNSHYTTMFLEEHNVLRSMRSGFCVYDTRGLDSNDMNEGLEEVSSWMTRGVRHNQPCLRHGDYKLINGGGTDASSLRSNTRYTKRKIDCVVVVADLSEINKAFNSGDLKPVETLKNLFNNPCIRKSNENPLLILTHGDKISAEERITSRLKICEYLGIPETTGAYDIACLTEQGILPEESDPVAAFALTEAVYRSLMQSDRNHLPKKNWKDWIVLFVAWIMCCIGSFFAMLAHFFSRFSHHNNKLKY